MPESVVKISGHSKSFQLYMKWNSASVSSAGLDSGRMIRPKIRHEDKADSLYRLD